MMKNLMRSSDNLPCGVFAATFPGVVYNVPGLFQFSSLIYAYVTHVERKFCFRIPIRYLYGAPPVKWNGGRLLLNMHIPSFTAIENEIRGAASMGIIPLITFSNMHLSESDLGDQLCNKILECLEDLSGGVIVSSNILFQYIRKRYPHIRIHASVIMCAMEQNRTVDYYKELSLRYDHYVIHPDDLFNIGILREIPSENAELLINERCFRDCPLRKEHYMSISREQISRVRGEIIDEKFLDHCVALPERKQLDSNRRNISMSISETQKLLNLGFRTIKLQGRTDDPIVFFFDLMRYTLEQEVAFPAMFPAFFYKIREYLKGR